MTVRSISVLHLGRTRAIVGLSALVALQIFLVSLSPAASLSLHLSPSRSAVQEPGRPDPANAGIQPPVSAGHIHPTGPSAASWALSFDGSSNDVEVADNPGLRLSAPLTMEAWIKPTIVFTGERYAVGKRTFALGIAPLGTGFQATFKFVTGGTTKSVASGQFPLNQWYHVVGDYDGSNMRLFVNGARVAMIVTSGTIDQTNTPLRIGSSDGTGDFFPGLIDEVRVSDTIRYRGNGSGAGFVVQQSPFSPDARTRGLWHLDEGTGVTTADASGNGNTGTLIKSPVWASENPFGGPDTTPPTISAIAADNPATAAATITWTTDEPATSQVEYGTTTDYGSRTTYDAALVTTHSQEVTGLAATTRYDFRVISEDAAGNHAISANTTFSTPATDPPPTPVIARLGAGNITASSATITWAMDVPADSQIEYGTTTAYGASTPVSPAQAMDHSVTIEGLTPDTEYHYRVKSISTAGVLTTSSSAVLVTGNATSATAGQWAPVMSWPLVDVHMALLPTGNVVMWDAWETKGTVAARLWDPTSQMFTGVTNQFSAIFCSGQAMLADGRQMVIGGFVSDDTGIKDTDIFNPATRSWTRVADMNYARWYPTATTLSDGRVLALGGDISPGVNADIPEIYDPATNVWTPLPGARLDLGEYPNAFLMPNGKVFVVAGSDNISRILDVNAQTWTVVGPTPVPSGTSLMYRPGKVAATGGSQTVDKLTAVIDLNQATPSWRQTASMAYPRFQQTPVQLPDGTVFVLGGADTYSLTATTGVLPTELWNPTTETWTTMASLQELRMYHSTAMLLPDGRVLVAGGGRLSPAIDHLTAEIYSPPYLFNGLRPTISSAPSATNYGTGMTVQTPDAASIAGVSFVRLSSVTHGFNMDQRYIDLGFTATGNALTVQSPANANIAPPGYYMLFIKNASGVPSVASIVQLGAPAQADTTPPTVAVTAPTSGATVSGTTVSLTATASDNVGVASVQFTLDGTPLGQPLTAAPYTATWNTTTTSNGGHTIGALAKDAAGNPGTATAVSVTVANTVGANPPVLSAVASGTPQSTSATVTWTTDQAATSQVDYGTTPAYGSSTTLDTTLVTSHSQVIAGLTASTTYHYRVRSANAGGQAATSGDFTFATAASGPALLVGDQTVEAQQDNNPGGTAEAFQYTAGASGTVDKLFVYVDGNNTAPQVIVGLYANTRDDNPGTVLAQGTVTNPVRGAWNSVAVSPTGVTANGKYWIAVLGPVGSGTVQFRDNATGGRTQTSAQTNLSLLPATWTPSGNYLNSPMSAYAVQSNSAPPDATPPTVAVTAPTSGATLSGTAVSLTATASDNVGVASVQFTLDGTPLGQPLTAAPYTATWNTTTTSNGGHTIGALAKDAAGNPGTATAVTVTVSNNIDTTPPTVSLTAPASGATVSGASVALTATASDNVGVVSVQFTLDGNPLGGAISTSPYGTTWNTTATMNGSHILGAQAKDAAGNTGTATTISVTVSNSAPDTTPPTVAVTAPTSGATVSGTTVSLTATASDNVGVASVQFTLDGTPLGQPLTAAPYTATWNTTTTSNGGHTIGALAKDAAGNPGTATAVSVTVANPPVISAVSASAITTTGATITWTTNTVATSQIDYGTSTAYGTSTTLDSTLVTSHSQAITGLTAGTVYHYRTRSSNAQSLATTSGDFTFTTTAAGTPVLVGDKTVEAQQDNNPAGTAEAFQYTASASGTASKLSIYIDSNNTATQLIVGLYSNVAGNNPGALLAQGTITNPTKGAWNTVTVSPTTVATGTSYWIAVLGQVGTVQFRDKAVGGKAQTSSQTNLTTLPATWTPGANYANAPFSAYAT